MARKKNKEQRSGGAPAWMTTFADLMSLLLTFFVLLLSFSTIAEPEKFEQALTSFRGAISIFQGSTSPAPVSMRPPEAARSRTIERIAREMKRRLQVLGREQEIDLKFDEGGLRISLPSQVLFDSGSAQLKSDAEPILREVSGLLGGVPGLFIEVRGYTDDRPLTTSPIYRDNYDLSYGRAKAVGGFLNQAGNISMEALELIAKGPTEPVATNESEEGRAANRRVELFVRATDPDADLGGIEERLGDLAPGGQEDTGDTAPVQ
jgi:chemotaxis protein MotB